MTAPRLSDYTAQPRNEKSSAIDFARLVQYLVYTKGGAHDAAERAMELNYPRAAAAAKALADNPGVDLDYLIKGAIASGTTSDGTWAGPLAAVNTLAQDLVAYATPMTVLGRLQGLRTLPFNTKVARITSGAGAGFVAQNRPIPACALAADAVTLGFATLGIIVPITEELAMSPTIDAQKVIAEDCARAITGSTDAAFLDPDRAAIADTSPVSVTYRGTKIDSSSSAATQLVADAKLAMKAVDAVRIPLSECAWRMTQNVAIHIASLLTATTDEPVFEDFAMAGGSWVGGLPVLVNGSIVAAASASEGMIVLHPNSVGVAGAGITLSVSRGAAIQMDTAPGVGAQALTSLWQNLLVAARLTRFINWSLLRAGGAATIRSINV